MIIPLSERVYSSLKSAIGCKSDINVTKPEHLKNRIDTNLEEHDDLEMVYIATKAHKAVLEDGAVDDSVNTKSTQKMSNTIDSISRFPVSAGIYWL